MPIESTPPRSPHAAPARTTRYFRLLPWLAGAGLVLPWIFNLRYFAARGSVAPQVFWPDAMANALTTAITLDVYWSALVFAGWVLHERRVRHPWAVVLACFGVGLSFALPLYLLLRRR